MSGEQQPLCGPAELVARLLEGRETGRHHHPETHGAISDDGVLHLVKLSYFTSQSVEEGRYPRFRLFVPSDNLPPSVADPWQLLRFSQPVPLLEVDDLRRLAPCAASHDFALEIEEQDNDQGKSIIACIGVRLAHSGEGGTKILSPSLWARHVRPGLMIRVDGPGELRVSEAGRALDLRAGKLIDLGGLPVHPLQGWQDELSRKLADTDRHERHISHTLHFAWNELIHTASEQGRGGCFVVLPKAGLSEQDVESVYDVHLKYPTRGLEFGKEIAKFVASSLTNAGDPDPSWLKELANAWLKERHTLLLHIESLAQLSGVDGCTVFDGDLRLLGFGGKILVRDTEEKRRFRDARTNKWLSREILSKTGTRHRSAFNLCNAREGVTCFVVSQDRHVTLLWSDADTVHRWVPYWPWAKRSDHF